MSRPLRVSAGTPVIIDTSVAFKWFAPEESGAEIAVELLRQHGRAEVALIAPSHMAIEIVNVLTCKRTPLGDIERAVHFLATADLLIAPMDDALLIDSARIARAERIALYDAAFIALAARFDAELVTADARQAAASSCRVRVVG